MPSSATEDISQLEGAGLVGRRRADRNFMSQLNDRYSTARMPGYAPRMSDTVTQDRALRDAEVGQLRRNRSVSAMDDDHRSNISAILSRLADQRSPTQTPSASRPVSAAGATAARQRRAMADSGGGQRLSSRAAATRVDDSNRRSSQEQTAAGPDGGGGVDGLVRRLIDEERAREIRSLEERRSVAVLLNSAFRADLEQLGWLKMRSDPSEASAPSARLVARKARAARTGPRAQP